MDMEVMQDDLNDANDTFDAASANSTATGAHKEDVEPETEMQEETKMEMQKEPEMEKADAGVVAAAVEAGRVSLEAATTPAKPKRQAKTGSRAKKEIEARKARKEATRAAREARAGAKAARVPKVKRQPFSIDALAPDAAAIVERSIAAVHAIGRKTTENVLDLGAAFEAMATVIPDPLDWREAVTRHCAVTVKTADNWRRVHRTLQHRREALVRHQVTPTVLIHLTTAPEAAVDQVITTFEAGQPMKVSEVIALVRKGGLADGTEPGAGGTDENGGLKGLKAQSLAKVARQTKGCLANLKAIRAALTDALAAAGEKRLKKGELIAALSPLAKQAHRDLTELLCDIDPASLVGGQALRHQKASDERWAGVLALLYRLAGDHWAEVSELKAFVTGEVLPMLAFVLEGTGRKAVNEEAVADVLHEHTAPQGTLPGEEGTTNGVAAKAPATVSNLGSGATVGRPSREQVSERVRPSMAGRRATAEKGLAARAVAAKATPGENAAAAAVRPAVIEVPWSIL